MTRRRFIIGASAAAVSGATPRRVRAATRRRLSIAYVPSTLFAPVFVAQERGYLADAGFDADLQIVKNGQDAIAFVATGRLDLIAAGVTGAYFNAVHRGLDVRYVGSVAYQPATGAPAALMLREDLYAAGHRSPDVLRGKTVAWVGKYGPSMYYVALILRKYGMGLRDVRGLEVGLPEQAAALQNKATDALFTNSPFTEAFHEQRLATTIAVPPSGVSATGLFAGTTLLKDRGALRACMAAMRRAASEISGSGYYHPQNIAAYAKYTKLSAETLKAADRYDFKPALPIDVPTLLDMQREFMREHFLPYDTPLAEEQLVARVPG